MEELRELDGAHGTWERELRACRNLHASSVLCGRERAHDRVLSVVRLHCKACILLFVREREFGFMTLRCGVATCTDAQTPVFRRYSVTAAVLFATRRYYLPPNEKVQDERPRQQSKMPIIGDSGVAFENVSREVTRNRSSLLALLALLAAA